MKATGSFGVHFQIL